MAKGNVYNNTIILCGLLWNEQYYYAHKGKARLGKLILTWSLLEDTSNYIIGNNRGWHATAFHTAIARGSYP